MTLCHFDAYLGFGDVPSLCPFLEILLLGSQVALGAGLRKSQPVVSGHVIAIMIAKAVLLRKLQAVP